MALGLCAAGDAYRSARLRRPERGEAEEAFGSARSAVRTKRWRSTPFGGLLSFAPLSGKMIKIIGSAIIILSLAVAFFGAVASINADKMAQLLSLAVEGFDKAEWKQHWLVSSAALAIAGCLGVFAGIGVLKNRKWGICLWACLLTALLIGQAIIVLSGYAMFSFEKMNPIETLIILIICIFSWAYYLKTKRQTTT